MKSRLSLTVTALLATSAVSLASFAAAPAFAPEPVASAYRSDGPAATLAQSIADTLNADKSLQGSKITVQFDENGALVLTGASLTQEQAVRAAQLAKAQAGGVAINAIQPDSLRKEGVQSATSG